MDQVKNANKKRICDISKDRRLVVIDIGNCPVMITANSDGTLRLEGATIVNMTA